MMQARLQLRCHLSQLVRMVFDNAMHRKAVGFVVFSVAIAMNLVFVNFALANQFCSGNTFIEPVVIAKFAAPTASNSSEKNWGYLKRECLAVKNNKESSEIELAITSTPDKNILKTEKFLHVARNLVNIPANKSKNYELTAQTTQIFDDKTKIDFWSKFDI